MDKVIEKILNEIEILKLPFPDDCPSYYSNTNGLIDKTKEIVKKASAEYNNDWIPCSERYLIMTTMYCYHLKTFPYHVLADMNMMKMVELST